jgi:hypothetical protein
MKLNHLATLTAMVGKGLLTFNQTGRCPISGWRGWFCSNVSLSDTLISFLL